MRRATRPTVRFYWNPIVTALMATRKAAGTRVKAKETVMIEGIRVTNRTANSILVRKSPGGVEVTDCCLEEQGM